MKVYDLQRTVCVEILIKHWSLLFTV